MPQLRTSFAPAFYYAALERRLVLGNLGGLLSGTLGTLLSGTVGGVLTGTTPNIFVVYFHGAAVSAFFVAFRRSRLGHALPPYACIENDECFQIPHGL